MTRPGPRSIGPRLPFATEESTGCFRGPLSTRCPGREARAQRPSWCVPPLRPGSTGIAAVEQRLGWLLDPRLTADSLESLSPEDDADQLWCHVRFCFRPEVRYAWGNAIKRIAQVESAATFFHSTGKAEGMPVLRTEDTAFFYAFLFNWGIDSYHG